MVEPMGTYPRRQFFRLRKNGPEERQARPRAGWWSRGHISPEAIFRPTGGMCPLARQAEAGSPPAGRQPGSPCRGTASSGHRRGRNSIRCREIGFCGHRHRKNAGPCRGTASSGHRHRKNAGPCRGTASSGHRHRKNTGPCRETASSGHRHRKNAGPCRETGQIGHEVEQAGKAAGRMVEPRAHIPGGHFSADGRYVPAGATGRGHQVGPRSDRQKPAPAG